MLLLITFIFNTLIALLTIVFHYEILYKLNSAMPVIKHIHARYKVLIAVGVIFLHTSLRFGFLHSLITSC